MLRALLWKEIREHFWRFIGFNLVLLLLVLTTSRGGVPPALDHLWQSVWVLSAIIGPIWLASWTVAGEHPQGTASTLAALPIRRLSIFTIKIIVSATVGGLSLLTPLAVALCVDTAHFNAQSLFELSIPLLCSFSLYSLLLAATISIRREGLAALTGLLVLLFCLVWSLLIHDLLDGNDRLEWLLQSPFPFFVYVYRFRYVPGWTQAVVPVQFCYALLYLCIAGWRYVRQPAVTIEREAASRRPDASGSLVISAFRCGPLLWKERREQMPAIVLTGAIGFLLSILFVAANWMAGYEVRRWQMMGDFIVILFAIGSILPSLVAVILGTHALYSDMHGPIADFWRSRPIPEERLFWTKFALALSSVLLLMGILVATSAVGMFLLNSLLSEETHSVHLPIGRMVIGQLFWLPTVLALSFFFSALFRRATYAVGAIFTCLTALTFGVNYSLGTMSLFEGRGPESSLSACMMLLTAALLFTLLARLAITKRWQIG